jgi:hypothetical protein
MHRNSNAASSTKASTKHARLQKLTVQPKVKAATTMMPVEKAAASKKAKVEQVRATAERKKQVRYERITKEVLLEMSRIAPSILSVDGLSVRLSFDRQNPEDVAAMNALQNHAAANLAALVADVPPEERERFIAAVFHIPEGLRKASDHE